MLHIFEHDDDDEDELEFLNLLRDLRSFTSIIEYTIIANIRYRALSDGTIYATIIQYIQCKSGVKSK